MADEHVASVYGKDIPISTKHAIEICNFIRGKSLQQSKKFLEQVIVMKTAVPFKIYKRNVGHKPGNMAAGRYPTKASRYILSLLSSLESNAENKGLDVSSLYLTEIIPNRASRPFHFGRKRRIKMKRTHIQIFAEERKEEKEKEPRKIEPKTVKQEIKQEKKKEVKK
ncbi:MAG: 50S ribosomal protein L22 [Nanoarchaeota archaeon]